MTLPTAEQIRINTLETELAELNRLVEGAGSKNQLNRLHVLISRELERLETQIASLETKAQAVLTLARKAQ